MKKLSERQKLFVQYYVSGKGFYQHIAYAMAYGKKNSSKRTRTANASRLMGKPHVKAYYKKLRDKQFYGYWREVEEKHEERIRREKAKYFSFLA